MATGGSITLPRRSRPGTAHRSVRSPAFDHAAHGWPAYPDGDFRSSLLSAIPAMRGFAASLCRDAATADDLVQETLVRAWANGRLSRPGTNMDAWLCTILRNQFYTTMRRRMREVEDAHGEPAGQVAEPASQDRVVALSSLRATLATLPEAQREALLMVGEEGCTYEEAAERLGCRVGTIKSRVSRARARLVDPRCP